MRVIKNFFRTLLRLVLVLVVLAFVNRRYLGGFKKLQITEQNRDVYTIAYKEFVGPYSNVGPSMDEVYGVLSGAGIVSYTGIGIYYDNPENVAPEKLRSDVGAIIDNADAIKLANNKDIKIKTMPAGAKVVTDFPIRNKASFMA